jgi:hypothetical protein
MLREPMRSLTKLLAGALVLTGLAVPGAASAAGIAVTRGTDPALTDPAGCSLRQAVQAANTNAAVGGCTAGEAAALDTISMPVAVRLSLAGADDTNAAGDLDIVAGGGPLRIEGTGRALRAIEQAAANERVLTLLAGSLALHQVRITGGNVAALPTPPANNGGGIMVRATAELTLTESVVSGNTAFNSGGIANGTRVTNDAGGTVVIRNSTVSGNTATATGGGGMGAGGIGSINGTLTIVNSTVAQNTTGARGGGVYNEAMQATVSTVTIASSTIADNVGNAESGNLHNSGNGGPAVFGVRNTIVTTPGDDASCGGGGDGTFTSLGHNLVDDDSCRFDKPTDAPPADPRLGPLADNGGLTPTRALLAGSPAIDRGNRDTAVPGTGLLTTDQRGLARPFDFPDVRNAGGGGTDIGAFERHPPGVTPPPPGGSDNAAPRLRIGVSRLRIGSRRVALLRLTCPRTEASPPCRGTVTLRTRKKVRFRGKLRQVVLAKASFRAGAGKTATVRLRLGTGGMALLRSNEVARQALAAVSVRDAAGNRRTVRKQLRLVLPR